MRKRNKDDRTSLIKFGKRIIEIRSQKDITQVQLADKCDMEKPNMARLEAGGTNPTFLTIKKIPLL